ncbi:MAG: hypothetical protein HRU15_13135, partial [Planctomycetes bacterium]|nr:hypothetical protein [Planctomycetota bacterium]
FFDFSFLYGDRMRYGRYGWAKGGCDDVYKVYDKYIPQPDEGLQVEAIDNEADAQRIYDAVVAQGNALLMDLEEFQSMLRGDIITGEKTENAFILFSDRGSNICAVGGDESEIEQLIRHRTHKIKEETGEEKWFIEVHGPRGNNLQSRIMQSCYWSYSSEIVAMYRVCGLQKLLSKAVHIAAETVPLGDDEVHILNTETEECIGLRASAGAIEVIAGDRAQATTLSALQVSELCFGIADPALFIEGLAANSPLRAVFPIAAYIPKLYAL